MEKENATTIFESLASGVRLDVFRLLIRQGLEGMVAGEIAATLGLPPANLSFHFKALTQAGLLRAEQEGRFQRYRANIPLMLELIAYLSAECCAGHPEQCAGLRAASGCSPAVLPPLVPPSSKENEAMKSIQVYDPALCCSTGVCGVEVDQKLVGFAADLDWARQNGASIERFNLAQQPLAFAENPVVKGFLERSGQEALPLILLDGEVALAGRYPSRDELARWAGIAAEPAKACCSGSRCC